MRVKVVYEKQNTGSYFSDNETAFFKIKVNKAPPQDFTFNQSGTFYLENAPVNPAGKKNTLYFRATHPGEQDEKNRNIIINILLGFLFVIMIIILPFAFMKFRSNKKPYLKLRFEYSDTHDFALILNKTSYKWAYEPVAAAPQEQSAFTPPEQQTSAANQ